MLARLLRARLTATKLAGDSTQDSLARARSVTPMRSRERWRSAAGHLGSAGGDDSEIALSTSLHNAD